jgi:hypothetical protein
VRLAGVPPPPPLLLLLLVEAMNLLPPLLRRLRALLLPGPSHTGLLGLLQDTPGPMPLLLLLSAVLVVPVACPCWGCQPAACVSGMTAVTSGLVTS